MNTLGVNTGNVIAGVGVGMTGLVIVGGVIGWVIKNWLANQLSPLALKQEQIASDVRSIKREVLPNGGASLADRVLRIETKVDAQDQMERDGFHR